MTFPTTHIPTEAIVEPRSSRYIAPSSLLKRGSALAASSMVSKDAVVIAALFAFCILLLPTVEKVAAAFAVEFWRLYDDANIAYAGYRASVGELPHMRFPYYYTGAWEILMGAVFKIAHASFAVARQMLGVCMAATSILLYALLRKAEVDRVTAALGALVGVIPAFAFNFVLFPAWPAHALAMGALLLFADANGKHQVVRLLLAGACLGLATTFKQTIGIYAMFAFLLAWILMNPAAAGGNGSHSRGAVTWSALLVARFIVLLLVPILILAVLASLLRSHFGFINFAYFLLPTTTVVFVAVSRIWKAGRASPQACLLLVQRNERAWIVLSSGFLVGLLPIVLVYGFAGGLKPLFMDSFVNVKDALTFLGFQGLETDKHLFLLHPLLNLKDTTSHVLPWLLTVISAAMILRASGRHASRRVYALLLTNSVMLVVFLITLYPLPLASYFWFYAPCLILPVIVAIDRGLKWFFIRPNLRAAIVTVSVVALACGYMGYRSVSGKWDWEGWKKIAVIQEGDDQAYVHADWAGYIAPVLNYLRSRPASETFIGYDFHNKTFAFLTHKPVQVDYFLRHNAPRYLSDADVEGVQVLAEDKKVSTVVLGKRSLIGSTAESRLLEYLNMKYSLVLDTRDHLVYQRREGEGR